MEMNVKNAMDDAKRWLLSAEKNTSANNYDIALYSMEMALEIAIKSFLIKNKTEYPKKHDVIDYFKAAGAKNDTRKELRENLDGIIKTFSKLLDFRNDAGYNFGRLKNDSKLRDESVKLLRETKRCVELIENAL
jgi:HEPN domain-containing protein